VKITQQGFALVKSLGTLKSRAKALTNRSGGGHAAFTRTITLQS
jgi:hypothetical protein